MKKAFWTVPAIAAAILLSHMSPAHAVLSILSDTRVNVTAVGDTLSIDYVCTTADTCGDAGSPHVDLTGMSTWTVSAIGADSITFSIVIMNTSSDPDSTTNRITQFGVKVLSPDPASASVTNGGIALDWDASVNTNFPTFNLVDLKIFEDDPGNAGLKEGQTDILSVTISNFTPALSSAGLTLEIFPIKYQGVGANDKSFQFAGIVVPEPASVLLFGIGLLGLGVAVRRRRWAA